MKSNLEKVTEYMSFGSPLHQAFVLEALAHYTKEILDNEAKIRKEDKNSFINPVAWIACAYDWKNVQGRI